MVNYCCVRGCGRNSKLSGHLNYYSLPKDRERQELWLKAGGREDLLDKSHIKLTYRFCSRHFAPSSVKTRSLSPHIVPTLCLPGSKAKDELEVEQIHHKDIACNACNKGILGFRYKCVTCADYDLCPKCEMMEIHSHHYMLRIPRPMKFKLADNLLSKWRALFKTEHVRPDCTESTDDCDSSDEEPIKKYVKHYDSGVDLSDDVKEALRSEVSRVLSLKISRKDTKKQTKGGKKRNSGAKRKTEGSDKGRASKRQKPSPVPATVIPEEDIVAPPLPEVAFADVNELADAHNEVKFETVVPSIEEPGMAQPLMHVKLSDDLTQLMIEVTKDGQKAFYKYGDDT